LDVYYPRTKAVHQSYDFWQPPPVAWSLSLSLILPYVKELVIPQWMPCEFWGRHNGEIVLL
jgi:hypothetical protein